MNVIEPQWATKQVKDLQPGMVFKTGSGSYYTRVDKTEAPFVDNKVYGISFIGRPLICDPELLVEIINGAFVIGGKTEADLVI